ncbi:MAG: hypothetical protein AAF371_15770 [Pseudomonadota bacterium]
MEAVVLWLIEKVAGSFASKAGGLAFDRAATAAKALEAATAEERAVEGAASERAEAAARMIGRQRAEIASLHRQLADAALDREALRELLRRERTDRGEGDHHADPRG